MSDKFLDLKSGIGNQLIPLISMIRICDKFNFKVDRIDISSYSFDEDHKYQRESQDRYYRIKSGKTFIKYLKDRV